MDIVGMFNTLLTPISPVLALFKLAEDDLETCAGTGIVRVCDGGSDVEFLADGV